MAMKITNSQLKILADGCHPRFAFVVWDTQNDWEQLIISLSKELLKNRLEKKNKNSIESDTDL